MCREGSRAISVHSEVYVGEQEEGKFWSLNGKEE